MGMLNFDDKQLFKLVRQDDRDAFKFIYDKYHKMLYILAFRYLKNQDAAIDIVQQSFTKLWEFRAQLSVEINLKNYLYSMTKNQILNQIRNDNNALLHNYKIAQENSEYEENLIENLEKKELTDILFKAIEQLPEQKKTVCLYKLEEKCSNQEIAEKMNISINTVKTHYAQSLKLLRNHIEKMLIFILYVILNR